MKLLNEFELEEYIKDNVAERVSGRLYFTTAQLRKIAKNINLSYDGLSKDQKRHFKFHCIDIAMKCGYLRDADYYYTYHKNN